MDRKLNGLKAAICQVKIVPGNSRVNGEHIVREIADAEKRGIPLIVFPELSVPGYCLGDVFGNDGFVDDVLEWNDRIRESTVGKDIVVVFGSLVAASGKTGKNGRRRISNAAIAVRDGVMLGQVIKTNHPNYGVFEDDRHFFSRKEESFESGDPLSFRPIKMTFQGKTIRLGIIICEDMWHTHHACNPGARLVEEGADIIINLSSSPYDWHKNLVRNEVARMLLAECKVPLIYVNNVGIQNNGKNIITFDGCSTVYDSQGKIVHVSGTYVSGTSDVTFADNMPSIASVDQDDTSDLYNALSFAFYEQFQTLPSGMRKVVIGLSGGIDSATTAALSVKVLGKENVFLVTMPTENTSDETLGLVYDIARRLDVPVETIPIGELVDAIAAKAGCKPGTRAYSNIQARVRMEILAAKTEEIGGVFIGNGNKVELAFGYGTMYGDIAGFVLPIGDLVKREVYQLADHMNRKVFPNPVIPDRCFTIAPMAELSETGADPFDYGNLHRRGYHDELVRAFVEFLKGPEWVLNLYATGRLEAEMKLDTGTLDRLFPTKETFVKDLERCWELFIGSVRKRVQAPPIIKVSRRSFGYDFRESMLGVMRTLRYERLKRDLLAGRTWNGGKRRIAVYGGSFNSPCNHHVGIAKVLTEMFDLVIVMPCGERPDKASANVIDPMHRGVMSEIAFGGLDRVVVDLTDIRDKTYTPSYHLSERYAERYPDADIWFAVGSDLVTRGADGKSDIQRTWTHGPVIWKTLQWVVVDRPGHEISPGELPPVSESICMGPIIGSGTMVRERLARGESIDDLVPRGVVEYIERLGLYRNSE
ncbi:MAG: NAD(+) synthase [Candidatus Moranbacteria bacterium]|nr:NAD(+) synthase [Candidatus Moranbacteria bacterium]